MATVSVGVRSFLIICSLLAFLVCSAAAQSPPVEETETATGMWTLSDTISYIVTSFLATSFPGTPR